MGKLRWSLPFLFALLFCIAYQPYGLGCLGFVALVPLLVYAQVTSGRKSFFVAWAGGYAAFAAGYSWFSYTVPVGPYLVAFYMGLWVPIFVTIVRKVGVAWSPVVWVAIEVLRSTLFSGLPWLLMGYTASDLFHVIQIADLGGIWLVSLLVASVNAALVHPSRAYKAAAAAALILSAVYGALRVPSIPLTEGPKIAVVQPNIPQTLKRTSLNNEKVAFENYEKHLSLTLRAAEGKPDLIIWPEAAIYKGVYVNVDGAPKYEETRWYHRLIHPAEETGIPLVSGLLIVNYGENRPDEYSNSAVMVDPEKGIVGRYNKIHLVPFAEQYWIFKKIVQMISGLRLESMTPGADVPVWPLGSRTFGAQICFEAIFPDISREIARKGAAFTVNISNDGWFKDSTELDQMLVMARYRSIENRIHVIRATNTGISAFIDPTGRVQAVLEAGGKIKEVEGVLEGRILVTGAGSVYRAVGDVVAWLALAGAAVVVLGRIFVDRKVKST